MIKFNFSTNFQINSNIKPEKLNYAQAMVKLLHAQIFLGADHGGFALKEKIKTNLSSQNKKYVDMGAEIYDENDDYPQFAYKVAKEVAQNQNNLGILICKTGGGMCIAANKVKGIRAVVCGTVEQAKKARETNDANILVLAEDYLSEKQAFEITDAFLETKFNEEERHVRRIREIEGLVTRV